ncbi:MAG: recombinase family protein [Firmicutes bacterium]|nr:recombinase family protein [Bacillota bacterium]
MTVKIIEATKAPERLADRTPRRKLKVAAYCRVSTDLKEQESSYEAQCTHYTRYIQEQEGWDFAGLYADEGISGTGTKKRTQFRQMIEDCEKGRIDMVVTKSISRFARNTVDCLQTIRSLKALGIAVFFEKENINTLDAKGEVLITIMASIAQQESQSISQNVSLGIRHGFEEGRHRFNYTRFLGYTRDPLTKEMKIVPEEARLVRRIYRAYLEGCSPAMIADRLSREGIPTPAGKTKWYPTTIASMLTNEKYAGDILMQKYYVEDFLTHRIVRNDGRMPMYYMEDAHEPIIPKAVFSMVQEEIRRRSRLKREPGKLRFGSPDALQGRLVCGICGRTLKRYHHLQTGIIDWRCRTRSYEMKDSSRERPGLCSCRAAADEEVKEIILETLNLLPRHRQRLVLQMHREKAFCRRMQIRMLIELTDAMQASGKSRNEVQKAASSGDALATDAACRRPEDFFRRTSYRIPPRVCSGSGRIAAFDDAMIIRYLDRVIVREELFEVRLKAGVAAICPAAAAQSPPARLRKLYLTFPSPGVRIDT